MIIYFMLSGALGILFLVSGRVTLPKQWECSGWKIPFYKSACFLMNLCGSRKKTQELVKDEEKLAEKLAEVLMILFLGLGISLAAEHMAGKEQSGWNPAEIARPVNGEGSRFLPLQVQIEGMTEDAEMEVEISERQYTDAEKNAFLENAMKELDTLVLGNNTSSDEVREKIYLPSELQDGKVSIYWTREVSPEDAVDEQGVISEDVPEEGVLLQLCGTLTCLDREAVYQRALRVFPPKRNPVEQLLYELEKKVKEADTGTVEEKHFSLPEEINGRSVIWKERKTSVLGICLSLTLIAAALSWFGKEQEFQKREQMRRQQLILDYPDLLFQLSMLLETGLTIQNAFSKIALNYREYKGKECRFVYEEMLVSCYEMQSGVSERKAYEDFGRRCGENCYIRLGTTLSGSLQKGAQGLTETLRTEAITAMEVRKQLAKKMGEEAGTKLLLPMMLMLLVVLVILMVPAVMSF